MSSFLKWNLMAGVLLFLAGCFVDVKEPVAREERKTSKINAASVGVAEDHGGYAAQTVVRELLGKVPDAKVIILLSSYEDNALVNRFAQEEAKDIPVVGVTAMNAFFAGGKVWTDNAVGGLAIGGEVDLKVAAVSNVLDKEMKAAGELIDKLQIAKPQSLILLCDPEVTHAKMNFIHFMERIMAGFPKDTNMIGGNSHRSSGSYGDVYYKGVKQPTGLVGIVFGGGFKGGVATENAYQTVSGPHVVTATAEFRGIQELDGRPVPEVYMEATGLPRDSFGKVGGDFPIGIKKAGKMYSRYPVPNREEGYFYRIPEEPKLGDRIYFLEHDPALMIHSAASSASGAMANFRERGGDSKPAIVFSVDCIGRSRRGFRQEELASFQKVAGEGVPVFGFYAAGEFATIPGEAVELTPYYCQMTSAIMVAGD